MNNSSTGTVRATKKLIPELRFPEFVNDGEWVEKALGEIAEIITGNTPSTSEPGYYDGNRMFVSPADINNERYITKTKTTLSEDGYSKTRHIKENSVLFVCIGSTIGKVAQNKYECATNQQINSLVPHSGYSNDFIFSLLEYSASKIASIAGKHAVPIINKTLFSSVKVFLPEYPEQQKIASCLSSLDEVINSHSQKLESLKDHKKGLMQNLFPQAGEKVPKLRFKEFKNSSDWEEKSFEEILFEAKLGGNYENSEANKGIPVIKMGNLDRGKINTDKIQYLPENKEYNHEDVLKKGDLLFNTRNTLELVGKVAIWRDELPLAIYNSNLLRLKFKSEFVSSNYFMNYVFNTQYVLGKLKSISTGTTSVAAIYGRDLNSIKFELPKIDEQQKIVECLSSLDALITEQAGKIEQLKLHKKGLMQGLFPIING